MGDPNIYFTISNDRKPLNSKQRLAKWKKQLDELRFRFKEDEKNPLSLIKNDEAISKAEGRS